ncbi:hypothetical protein N0V90_006712 [Kalmusia sp. IMI 367209]|nr:hypothetical protein N0V90_006712 [Kalmusia sp. IMI 367209]
MDDSRPSLATAFNTLPIELNKEIAHHLDDHKDIANFSLICKAARDAINGDGFSFWRTKFSNDFARPSTKTNKHMRKQFMHRWQWMRHYTNPKLRLSFIRGHGEREVIIVNVLKELINESFTGDMQPDEHGYYQCLNMVRLKEFVLQSRILLGGKRPPAAKNNEPDYVDASLAAVRLMCAHFLFDQEGQSCACWYAIDESQKAVYAATNTAPLYIGPKKNCLNMEWMLHCLNFFRYHMMTPDASSLYDTMKGMDVSQKPSPWRGPLQTGSYPLSRWWKGTYAFLEHDTLARFRAHSTSRKAKNYADMIVTDLNVDEGKIQSLQLNFPTVGDCKWPDAFEDRLHSLRDMDTTQTRAQHSKKFKNNAVDAASKNIRFDGKGEDLEDDFYATGWLNPLEDQPCGISGWQRITFMKHFDDDLNQVDQDNLWAYEGVVLPGGRIILGRWWFASNDYSGPFILWAVDPDPDVTGDEESNDGQEDY